MNPNKIIDKIREKFYKRVDGKTGWGKNELKAEFEKAIADALAEILTEMSEE